MTSCIISPACSKSSDENWNALAVLRAEREGTRRLGDGEGEVGVSAISALPRSQCEVRFLPTQPPAGGHQEWLSRVESSRSAATGQVAVPGTKQAGDARASIGD